VSVRRAAAGIAFASWSSTAAPHGFGQRFDLPLPLWLWITAAGATIVLTFVVIAIFVRTERIVVSEPPRAFLRFVSMPGIAHRVTVDTIRIAGVAVFILTTCAGLFGTQDPYANLAPTMIWVVWWVGLAFICALAGDLWTLVNPLSSMFEWAERGFARLTRGGQLASRLRYPPWLGVWPGVALFLCFAWAELLWQQNDIPRYLAYAMVAYAAVTWTGMLAFGRDTWLANGEAFSIAFGVLARFAPLAPEPRGLNVRLPGTGLIARRPVSVSFVAFVLLMLASVTFDGFLETPLNQRITTALHRSRTASTALFALSEWGLDETQIIATTALIGFALGFIAAFWLTSSTMVLLTRRDVAVAQVACSFVLTLVPIAVAYHLSHYFSLLLTAGQFIIPLVSDPFGWGWNLFGTAGYKVDLSILSPYVFWYSAVTIIVVGHVIAVVLAHIEGLRVFGRRRDALVSQIPMVVLMVAYTTLSLWILAQPIVG
jgi:hypothetical protein